MADLFAIKFYYSSRTTANYVDKIFYDSLLLRTVRSFLLYPTYNQLITLFSRMRYWQRFWSATAFHEYVLTK